MTWCHFSVIFIEDTDTFPNLLFTGRKSQSMAEDTFNKVIIKTWGENVVYKHGSDVRRWINGPSISQIQRQNIDYSAFFML